MYLNVHLCRFMLILFYLLKFYVDSSRFMFIYVEFCWFMFIYVDVCGLHPFPTEIQNLCTFSIILRVVFKMWVKSSIPLNCSTLLDIARRFLTVCSTLLDMARRFLTVCSTWLDMARRCSTWLDVARSPNFSGMLFLKLIIWKTTLTMIKRIHKVLISVTQMQSA